MTQTRGKLAKKVGELVIQDTSRLAAAVKNQGIDIGIVAVPPSEAQAVIDCLVGCGIKAILNYAPVAPVVPSDVQVFNIDPVVALQTLTYHLKSLTT